MLLQQIMSLLQRLLLFHGWSILIKLISTQERNRAKQFFRNKTKGLASDKRFTLQRKDAQSIRRYLAAKSDSLGSVVTRIPIAFDINANPVEFGNLLTDYGSIPMYTLIHLLL